MSAYAPIETPAKLDTAIVLATRQPEVCERMVEAFMLAVWSRDFRNFSR